MQRIWRLSVFIIFIGMSLVQAQARIHPLPDRPDVVHDPKISEELRGRDGLPNFFAKLKAGGPVRIAYLGGSITAANGWRPKTFAWFQSQYPDAKLIEINAAISGTGSDFGACRIEPDVLSQNPDLVFMEHRVNGGGGFEAKSVEGIVRQIWKAHPRIDICLVYTLSEGMLKTLQVGKQPGFGVVMETMANAYGIPSIDLGVEVARREQAGELIFKGSDTAEGTLIFSRDGVHPGEAGHDLYRDIIARSMLAMKDHGVVQAHGLPTPLEAGCWETTTLVPITDAVLSSGWHPVDTKTDPVYRDDVGRTHAMLRGAVTCDRVGETLTVAWHGTTIGFSDIPQGSGMEIEVIIDQGAPIRITRPQREAIRRYARFVYLPEQSPGDHTAVLRVTKLPAGLSFYAGQILVIGTVPKAVACDHTSLASLASPDAVEAVKTPGAPTIDEKYAALVATLSPEAQAWERVLQENLGSFYLPIYKAGRLKGTKQAWDYVKDDPELPRVLIIGDSISRGYTLAVRAALAGKANVHRAPENCGPSANGLKKLDLWLGTGQWDIITWNFGIHDRRTPPADYRANLETLLKRLQQTGAKILWVRTTPAPPSGTNSENFSAAQCTQLNAIADDVMTVNHVREVDLYTLLKPRLSELQLTDNVHFHEAGYQVMGEVIAQAIYDQVTVLNESSYNP